VELEYEVVYSKRKTIALLVERDRSIVVRAPNGTSAEAIQQAIEAKQPCPEVSGAPGAEGVHHR
jgi:predicted metal-dependent hydrolase